MKSSFTQTILKGLHPSLPFRIRRVSKELFYQVNFNKSVEYTLEGKDQKDFNKLIGVKKNFFRPRHNSVMVGFRWNPVTALIELTPYIHKNGYRVFGNHIIDFDYFTQSLKVKIDLEKGVTFIVDEVPIFCPHNAEFNRGWLIAPWFGGNKRSPKCIKLKFTQI